jgi:pimeloyl-ACP methyl ester carboxylesterase
VVARFSLGKPMQILFVHGMGRSPLSGLPLFLRLKAAGHSIHVFAYSTMMDDVKSMQNRLLRQIEKIAKNGKYILIGHSLGGVLIRGVLNQMPQDVTHPEHLFLLGSPIRPARLAQRLGSQGVFQFMTGDCGQLLASEERMGAIGSVAIPTTCIIGTKGFKGVKSPFGNEDNDGVVSVDECHGDWVRDKVFVPVIHTFLPSSGRVSDVILDRIRSSEYA